MDSQHVGQLCALLTAIVWAFAVVLFKLCGERIAPVALNLLKNGVGLALLLATLAVMNVFGYERLDSVWAQGWQGIGLLLLSGVLGIAVADTLFFRALNLIGVGLISIVDCTYSPFAIFFAWWLLGEQLTIYHTIGAALIVVGVFAAERHTLPVARTAGQITGGMLLAAFAIALMALGIVMVKPVLEAVPLMWGTTLRLAGGFGALALFCSFTAAGRRHWTVFRPSRDWRVSMPASFLAAYVCLVLWIAGFKYTGASVAAVLNQTSVVFQSLLAAVVLKERLGWRQAVALGLALAGVLVLTLGPTLRELLFGGQTP
jgi:drug/metabolite transporter (DMT)-like permease